MIPQNQGLFRFSGNILKIQLTWNSSSAFAFILHKKDQLFYSSCSELIQLKFVKIRITHGNLNCSAPKTCYKGDWKNWHSYLFRDKTEEYFFLWKNSIGRVKVASFWDWHQGVVLQSLLTRFHHLWLCSNLHQTKDLEGLTRQDDVLLRYRVQNYVMNLRGECSII